MGFEPHVGRILMPADEAGVTGFLHEQDGGADQDVGTDQVLHRIEDAGVMNDLVQKSEGQVRIVATDSGEGVRPARLRCFQLVANTVGFHRRHDRNRRHESVTLVAGHLLPGQFFRHWTGGYQADGRSRLMMIFRPSVSM